MEDAPWASSNADMAWCARRARQRPQEAEKALTEMDVGEAESHPLPPRMVNHCGRRNRVWWMSTPPRIDLSSISRLPARSGLPAPTRKSRSQHDEFEAKFFEERAALEAKYQKMYEPLYSKRHDVVNGVVEVEGVTKDDSGEAAADQKANSGFVVPLVICCLVVSELGAGAKSLLLSLEPPSSSDASGEYFFSDYGLGILEPIKASIRDAKLGVGKQEQDDFFTASANFCIIF
ncbi:Nucleosome assembly protein 1-like protein 1 [Hordeum vulgare]|nr:Nucleosome assembly protein 1-like protein 1 [Hordeum vulgare]